MMLIWFLWVLVFCIVLVQWVSSIAKKQRDRNRAIDVAVAEVFHESADELMTSVQVDFRTFKMIETHESPAGSAHRVFQLRRSASGIWDRMESPDSHSQWRAHRASSAIEGGSPLEEAKPLQWEFFDVWGEVERTYQEFVIELTRGNRAPELYDPLREMLAGPPVTTGRLEWSIARLP